MDPDRKKGMRIHSPGFLVGNTRLLVIRCPNPAGSRNIWRQHGGPISLASHGAHEDKPVLKKVIVAESRETVEVNCVLIPH